MSKKNDKKELKIDGQVEHAILALIDQRIDKAVADLYGLPVKPTENDGEPTTEGDEPDHTVLLTVIKDNIVNGDELFDAIHNVATSVIEDIDIEDRITDTVDSYYIQENIDMSDIASSVEDHIDWDCRISENIDVGESIIEFIDNGCGTVDDVCKKIVARGTSCGDYGDNDDDIVILTLTQFSRIMEVIDMIKPPKPAKPTPQDLAGQLIAQVEPGDAIELVAAATIEKAQADAQAIVDVAVLRAGDSE